MKAILYSTGCPRCVTLKRVLDRDGVDYEVVSDIEQMKSLGIESVPVLEYEGKQYSFLEAIKNMGNILEQQRKKVGDII